MKEILNQSVLGFIGKHQQLLSIPGVTCCGLYFF
jgi:hypothetical protein